MVASLNTLKRAITGTKWYANHLEQKILSNYRFDIQSMSPDITSVIVTYDDGATQNFNNEFRCKGQGTDRYGNAIEI